MKLLTLNDIKLRIDLEKIIRMQEEGFRTYSEGRSNIPPVGYIKLSHTPVRYHIKYGAINNDDIFVVKLAGGLEQTTLEFGQSKIEGMIVVIDSNNGKPIYILQDEGYLTQLRTAVAGFIAAKYLAPKKIKAIGVLGTGMQALMQVEILKELTDCRTVFVWGRTKERTIVYKENLQEKGFNVSIADSPSQVAQYSNLIITTTSSTYPLLNSKDIKAGTHITAMGADAPGKQELDPYIFEKMDIIAVDSKEQCYDHGEISAAFKEKIVIDKQVLELGEIISNPNLKRTNENQTTIVDLTGVAVQDIQIAKAIIQS